MQSPILKGIADWEVAKTASIAKIYCPFGAPSIFLGKFPDFCTAVQILFFVYCDKTKSTYDTFYLL